MKRNVLHFHNSSAMTYKTMNYIFGMIWMTMLTVQIANLGNMGVMSCRVRLIFVKIYIHTLSFFLSFIWSDCDHSS